MRGTRRRPRPPSWPTGPRGPLRPCPARLVPHRRPQHATPPTRPTTAPPAGGAQLWPRGARERPRPWRISSGGRPTQSPGSCSRVVWGAWGRSRAALSRRFGSCHLLVDAPPGRGRGLKPVSPLQLASGVFSACGGQQIGCVLLQLSARLKRAVACFSCRRPRVIHSALWCHVRRW